MVHHKLDTRHVTMSRFPMQWIHDTKTFLGTARGLCTQFGEVVERSQVFARRERNHGNERLERRRHVVLVSQDTQKTEIRVSDNRFASGD